MACVVPACTENRLLNSPFRSFSIPENKLSQWSKIIFSDENLLSTFTAPHICEKHFETKYVFESGLDLQAVPTLNLLNQNVPYQRQPSPILDKCPLLPVVPAPTLAINHDHPLPSCSSPQDLSDNTDSEESDEEALKNSDPLYKIIQSENPSNNGRKVKFYLDSGINQIIIQYLTNASRTLDQQHRQCMLTFDEVSIQPHVQYNSSRDIIEGFANTISEQESSIKNPQVADGVLVFMLNIINCNWKTPVAYHFINRSTKHIVLKHIIKDLVSKINQTGYVVKATVSNLESCNVEAINSLVKDSQICENESNAALTYIVDNKKIYHIFDPPNLLLSFRDNFLTKNILFGTKRAEWQHIICLLQLCERAGEVASVILTEQHVNLKGKDKLKVEYAAAVLHHDVAAAINILLNASKMCSNPCHSSVMPLSAEFTVEVIDLISKLFESLNGSGFSRKGLKYALSRNSKHLTFWTEAIETLKSWKFDAETESECNPMIIKHIELTIGSVKELWQDLRKLQFKYLNLRQFNQDPLKSFLVKIQAQLGQDADPTSSQFIRAYETVILQM